MIKMYMIYNDLTQQLEGNIFLARNDKHAEAIFKNDLRIAKEKNKYFDDSIYNLCVLGVLETDNIIGIGITHDNSYKFPYMLDKIKVGQRPEAEQSTETDITVDTKEPEKEYEKIKKQNEEIK